MNFDLDIFMDALTQRAPQYLVEHLQLVVIPLSIAAFIALSAGIILTRPGFRHLADRVMVLFNAGQTIPPLAVIAIFFPFLGLGYGPAILALTIYALLPISRNTIAAVSAVPREVLDAARGMGMTSWQVLCRVELPLSVPTIMAGIRTSAVLTVSTAVLAALVGGKGMGAIIFAGINFFRPELVLAGTIYIGAMAVAMERVIAFVEWLISPAHLK